MDHALPSARALHITGIVEGVGFRPFVFNLARSHGLTGWVNNADDGVHALVCGDERSLDLFLDELPHRAPVMSRIDSIEVAKAPLDTAIPMTFEIIESTHGGGGTTLVSPDIATCPQCLSELLDPRDRRYHYPFINCTQCGPRFTIIEGLPYDRPSTTMGGFAMCPSCSSEYRDPSDRRFHAQPDACFDCGPAILLAEGDKVISADDRASSDAILGHVAERIDSGDIVAVKGLGGFHLVCDATNEDAVSTLRARKRRPDKPFAVMMPTLDMVRRHCLSDEAEEALLTGTVRPIVLLTLRDGGDDGEAASRGSGSVCGDLAPSVAPRLHELGVMLPYTPLQHLLLALLDRPLVMTSGNMTEEPIIADDTVARRDLAPIADCLLGTNREIVSRYDDSVTRVVEGRITMVRRARGFAPSPIAVPASLAGHPPLLATGPEQKNTFTLVNGGNAFVSQHLGDVEDSRTWDAWLETESLFERLFATRPEVIVCDEHPRYLTTQWARESAVRHGLPLIEVQHHHAHIASVTGEHGFGDPVVGIALDGTGWGGDGTVWGGEILVCDWRDYRRVAHLEHIPLPGGAAAVHNPCRTALAALVSLGLGDHPGAARLLATMGERERSMVVQMVERGVNSPLSSSAGRLFDVVGALCGIAPRPSYDGQTAMELEAAAGACDTGIDAPASMPVSPLVAASAGAVTRTHDPGADRSDGDDVDVIRVAPLLEEVLDLLCAGVCEGEVSRRFHRSFARAIVEQAVRAAEEEEIHTVALSGGVYMNRLVLSSVTSGLVEHGFDVLANQGLPANDGGISYGQAIVALARLKDGR